MTEDQAKRKWCPMVRVKEHATGVGVTGINRDSIGGWNTKSTCIGSDCMMWREKIDKEATSSLRRAGQSGVEMMGYCGLGGKP